MNEILQVATFAGQIILESGGETYRVEDTILRICKRNKQKALLLLPE